MEDEYEVPSPHERELEEAVEKERDGLTQNIALMTAILATIGALISYQPARRKSKHAILLTRQIAIALADITVLTKRRWLLWGSVASAAIGIATATAFF